MAHSNPDTAQPGPNPPAHSADDDHSLAPAQVARYREQGFLFPLPAISAAEAAHYRALLESVEAQAGDRAGSIRTDLHLLTRWAWDLVHDPRIVEPVADILGPNVLCWSLNWFIKEPGVTKFVSYHQDSNYWGLTPFEVTTAWLALSDAGPATGPMKFIPGSHHWPAYEHTDTFDPDNLLSRGQVLDHPIDESAAVLAPLSAGQMSLHHVHLAHASSPNTTSDRRIGMVIRYASTKVRQTKLRDTAVLVRGQDDYHHFDLQPPPAEDFGASEVARHKDAMTRMGKVLHSKDAAPSARERG